MHEKCMCCGAPIPELFKLAECEKEKIREALEEREKKTGEKEKI